MMKTLIILIAVMLLTTAVTGFCEVVCKEVVIDTTHYRYYYSGEDTVAIEEVQGDTVMLLQGRIPDGIVRSYNESSQSMKVIAIDAKDSNTIALDEPSRRSIDVLSYALRKKVQRKTSGNRQDISCSVANKR